MNFLHPYLQKKRHVVWDWNGTLMADVEHAVNCINALLGNHGLPLMDRDRYREVFAFPIEDYYRRLGFDFTRVPFPTLAVDFYDRYMAGFRNCPLQTGAETTLARVAELGLEQSVLSAAEHATLHEMLGHYGIVPHFRKIQGIENKMAKSKVTEGQRLLADSPFAPAETILIGDTDHDIEVGQELGIDVVIIAHGHQSAERLRKLHPHVIESF